MEFLQAIARDKGQLLALQHTMVKHTNEALQCEGCGLSSADRHKLLLRWRRPRLNTKRGITDGAVWQLLETVSSQLLFVSNAPRQQETKRGDNKSFHVQTSLKSQLDGY